MKIVQFSPSERVDLPDATAMSWLPVGEFRRLIRTLIAGGTTSSPDLGRIVKGFKVEQASSTTIEVNFDINGDGSDLSVAVGGHEFIGSDGGFFIDQGQLIGDKGIENEQESGGAATRTINFSGDPSNNYIVEMRFTLTAAESGNRAFWDPSSNTEFIDNVETRYVPGWEIRRVASPSSSGPDWIPLAIVLWTGSTIGMITDIRDLALEGVSPWSGIAQNYTFGPGDFDRSTDRGDPTVGQNSIWGAIRALERQIMDLKGQDENGLFNWWNRAVSPGPAGGAINASQTKSLRTLDIITFKIGNGVDDWGDFNGADGLDDCLTYIEDNRDDLPKRIKIVLRGREAYGTYDTVFNITSEHSFDNIHLEIIGDIGNLYYNQTLVQVNLGAPGIAISLMGGLVLRNIHLQMLNSGGGENGIDVVATGQSDDIRIENCMFEFIDSATTEFALKVPSRMLRMTNSTFSGGTAYIGGNPYSPNEEDESIASLGGQIDSCYFGFMSLVLRRNTVTASSSRATVNDQLAHNLSISNCKFRNSSSSQVTNNAMVSGWGCRGLTFFNCDFEYDANHNCIQLGGAATTTIDFPGLNTKILHCRFYHRDANHTPDIIGLGWAIVISNETIVPTTYTDVPKNFLIADCRFLGENLGTSSDGFGIWANNVGNTKVRDCTFEAGKPQDPLPAANLPCVFFSNTNPLLALLGAGLDNTIENCQFGPHKSFYSNQTYFPISCLYQSNITIRGNNIYRTAYDASAPNPGTHNYSGIVFNNCNGIISENTIQGFLTDGEDGEKGTGIWGLDGGYTQISNNRFIDCGGTIIDYTGSSGVVSGMMISNNYFLYTKVGYNLWATISGGGAISFDGVDTSANSYIGNRWNITEDDAVPSYTAIAIHYGNDANPMILGNCFPYGRLETDDPTQTPIADNGVQWGGIGRNKSGDNGSVYFEVGPTGNKQTPAFNVFNSFPSITT